MPWVIEYYTASNNTRPVQEWLNELSDKTLKAVMRSKITSLNKNGLFLLKTKAMERIGGNDDDLYELKGGQGRITVYFDREQDVFVLLNAFRKKKGKQKDKIEQARRFLHNYLDIKGD